MQGEPSVINGQTVGYVDFGARQQHCTYLYCGCNNNRTLSSPQVQLPAHFPTLVRELDLFFWTMYIVLALKPEYRTVPTMELETIIVPTLKMLVLNVKVSIMYGLY